MPVNRVLLVRLGLLIRLTSPLGEVDGKMVILKEVQMHPFTSRVLHADFFVIDPNRPLRVHVALHFEGKAAGVTAGGILQPIRRDVTVECLPAAIPAAIAVNVEELGIHDTIHVEDLEFPEDVRSVAETNFVVITVLPPTVEAAPSTEEEAAEAPAEGEAAAPPAAEQEASSGKGDKGKKG